MKKKGLAGSLAVLVALTGVYVAVDRMEQKSQEAEKETEALEPVSQTASEDEMKEVTIHSVSEELTFQKEGDQWIYPEKEDFPLDTELLADHISSLADFTPKRIIEEPGELSEYGLENPSLSVSVVREDDTTFTYLFGDVNSKTGDSYLMVDGEDTIYMVDSTTSDTLQFSVYDVAEMEEVPEITSDSIQSITVHRDGEDTVSFRRDEETGVTWSMTTEGGIESTVNITNMTSLLTTAAGMYYERLADEREDSIAEYGLDDPQAEIVIHYKETIEAEDMDTEDAEPEEADTEAAEPEDADMEESEEPAEEESIVVEKTLLFKIGDCDADNNYYYAQESGSTRVYLISAGIVSQFMNLDAMDYVDKTVQDVNLQNLDTLKVTYQGETKELYSVDETVIAETEDAETEDAETEDAETEDAETEDAETEEEPSTTEEIVTHYYVDDTEVESLDFSTFINKLSNLEAQSILAEWEKKDADPDLVLKVKRNDGSESEYRYYAGDNGLYTVVPDTGYPLVVSKTSVEEILEAYETLLS